MTRTELRITGREVSRRRQQGQPAAGALALRLRVAEHLVFTRIHAALGGRLQWAVSGGAPLARDIAEFFHAAGMPILEGYGLTETSPLTHANPIERAKAGSIGMPLPDTDARVVDLESGTDVEPGAPGELLIRGPQVMKGYWQRAEATAETIRDGWLRTGDVATMDGEGYFAIVDRKKDVINTAGFKVWPREVEEVLYAHPAIRLAAVVGVPDDYRGEAVKACVVLKDGPRAALSERDVIEFCRARLSAYKAPRTVEFRDALPVTAAGKMLRRELRQGGPHA